MTTSQETKSKKTPVQWPCRTRAEMTLSDLARRAGRWREMALSHSKDVHAIAVPEESRQRVPSVASTRLSSSLQPSRRRRKSTAWSTQVRSALAYVSIVSRLTYRVADKESGLAESNQAARSLKLDLVAGSFASSLRRSAVR
jgi:hypothetical protein